MQRNIGSKMLFVITIVVLTGLSNLVMAQDWPPEPIQLRGVTHEGNTPDWTGIVNGRLLLLGPNGTFSMNVHITIKARSHINGATVILNEGELEWSYPMGVDYFFSFDSFRCGNSTNTFTFECIYTEVGNFPGYVDTLRLEYDNDVQNTLSPGVLISPADSASFVIGDPIQIIGTNPDSLAVTSIVVIDTTNTVVVLVDADSTIWTPDRSGVFVINYISVRGVHADTVSVMVFVSVPQALEDNFVTEVRGLFQNYPNPFNPATTIRWAQSQINQVQLAIYNVSGQLIQTLVNERNDVGEHSISWDGRDSNGIDVGSGVYFYHLKVGDQSETKKMVLIR